MDHLDALEHRSVHILRGGVRRLQESLRGDNRIAHLEQRIESADDGNKVQVNGAGTIDVNLGGGDVAASAIEWTSSGSVPPRGGGAQSTPARGRIKINVTANE
jgi:hypothetical protein